MDRNLKRRAVAPRVISRSRKPTEKKKKKKKNSNAPIASFCPE